MQAYAIRHPEAAVLYQFAVLLRAGAQGVGAAAQRLDAWLERRRLAADARRDLSEMTDHQLLDIGISRADIDTAVRGASPRAVDERVRALAFDALMRS